MQSQTNCHRSLGVSPWLPLVYSDLERVDVSSTPEELYSKIGIRIITSNHFSQSRDIDPHSMHFYVW